MDVTDKKATYFVVDKINGRWQVKGKLSRAVQVDVCRKCHYKSL